MLLILDGFQYTTSLHLDMGYYHIQTRKTQVTYVRLFSHGGNIDTSAYQGELPTHQKIYSKK